MAHDHGKLFNEIQARIVANPCISLARIAGDLGADRRVVQNVVFENTGMRFRRYKQVQCLRTVISMLSQDGNLQQKRISADLGYGSTAAFARFVRKSTGLSLTEIRDAGNAH